MNTHTPTLAPRRGRLVLAAVAGAMLVLAAAVVPAVGATAAPTAATATPGTGWLRLGHLSPDTKSVDVRVAALKGGATLFELKNVTYGAVSAYSEMPQGTYTVSMVPAGSSKSTPPVISASVKIAADHAVTVAAYGPNKSLQVKAFTDDLATPAAGNARIRLIQASTITSSVDVKTTSGLAIATAAKRGSATSYAEIPAGSWKLALKGKGVSDTADVSVAAGSVTTLFVLDTSDGGLTILPVLDSAAVGAVPIGSVATGGGYLALHRSSHGTALSSRAR